jgi:bifunctional non-homologous end joining protein LigD
VPASSGPGVGALRLATQDLRYVGKVGMGFTHKSAMALRKQLDLIAIPKPPIKIRKPNTVWVKPTHAARIEYRDITDDGMLRHPSFKGLV